MDKYNAKTSFQEWVSSINFDDLSEKAKGFIKTSDYYSKKLDFQTSLNVLLYAAYEKLPSYREIERAFLDPRLCEEIGIDSLCHSSLSRKNATLSQEVLIDIFTQLVAKVTKQQSSSKANRLQLIDLTTIPLNKTWFPWAKFRKTKAGIKLHLNLCYLDKNNQYPESFTITKLQKPMSMIATNSNVSLIKLNQPMS